MFNQDNNIIELNEEAEIKPEEYENGEILPVPTGSPYYDRNTPNLKVKEQMQKYGLKSKREVMDFFLEMMPREIIKGNNLT